MSTNTKQPSLQEIDRMSCSYRGPYGYKFERDLAPKELPTLKWKEQLDSSRMQEDFTSHCVRTRESSVSVNAEPPKSTSLDRVSYRGPYAYKFERDSAAKELPTMKWKELLDSSRMQEDFTATSNKNVARIGLKNVTKLFKKEAEAGRMIAHGKRVPLGNNVSSNINGMQENNLKKKCESKRFLKKIQSKLPDLC